MFAFDLLTQNKLFDFSIEANCEQTFHAAMSYKLVENFLFCAEAHLPFCIIFNNHKRRQGRMQNDSLLQRQGHWGSEKIFLVIKLKQCPQIIGNSL